MAEWPCCHDPLRFSPSSLRFVPPPSYPPFFGALFEVWYYTVYTRPLAEYLGKQTTFSGSQTTKCLAKKKNSPSTRQKTYEEHVPGFATRESVTKYLGKTMEALARKIKNYFLKYFVPQECSRHALESCQVVRKWRMSYFEMSKHLEKKIWFEYLRQITDSLSRNILSRNRVLEACHGKLSRRVSTLPQKKNWYEYLY